MSKRKFEEKNCNNCKFCGLTDDCEKLRALPEFKALYSEELLDSSKYLETWSKKNDIKHSHCCDEFASIWISYPMVVSAIVTKPIDYKNNYLNRDLGNLVKIRPCGEEYKNKTYLGLSLGELPTSISSSYSPTTHVLTNSTSHNPAIYVFDLHKIIFGYESWWSAIENENELKEITDKDIDNTWYVKLLKGESK